MLLALSVKLLAKGLLFIMQSSLTLIQNSLMARQALLSILLLLWDLILLRKWTPTASSWNRTRGAGGVDSSRQMPNFENPAFFLLLP